MKFDKVLMNTAVLWSKESYCKRKQVGAVIAHGSEIVAQGFNGTVTGTPNCCEHTEKFRNLSEITEPSVKCTECNGTGTGWIGNELNVVQTVCDECNGYGKLKYIDKTNPQTIHAESNALMSALRRGISTKDCTMYVTLAPCLDCSKLIIQAGITKVFYKETYSNDGIEFLRKCNIIVEKLDS